MARSKHPGYPTAYKPNRGGDPFKRPRKTRRPANQSTPTAFHGGIFDRPLLCMFLGCGPAWRCHRCLNPSKPSIFKRGH